MWCYYNNADEVELFINGKSQGVRRKADSHQYHVMWRVTFDPGEVKAVSRKDGKVVCEQTIKTAGAPAKIRLSKDYVGKELTFINAEVVDKDGNLCPWAEDQISFISEGGEILATDNGCQTSMERMRLVATRILTRQHCAKPSSASVWLWSRAMVPLRLSRRCSCLM